VVAEKSLIFEVTDFSVIDGIISLLASYYVFHVNYPRSVPAQSLLLFFQEYLVEQVETTAKKSARYRAMANSIKSQERRCLEDIQENPEESES
jgi:hypothetical protein